MGKIVKYIAVFIMLCAAGIQVSAQKRESGQDSLVRLLSASKASLVEQNGKNFRKVTGNVVFLHNDTYLYCDSAYWNVEDRYIDALGHIVIDQEKTTLTGDSIKYVIDENTAKFRGHLVQLKDKEGNILRTNHLDYNTKDSVASFSYGAAMKDKDGNLIESVSGSYDSKRDVFHFFREVEMFSDSLFFKCDDLEYLADSDFARFKGNIRGWYDTNNLSADNGWYDRNSEKFFFSGNVHSLTEDYELWSDSLYYDRYSEFSNLHGNVQLLDTVDNAIILCGELKFWNNPRRAELYRDPVMILLEENSSSGAVDSTFMASDTLIYFTKRMCDVDSAIVELARGRRELALTDPLAGKKAQGTGKGSGTQKSGPGASVSGGAKSVSSGAAVMQNRPSGTLPMPYSDFPADVPQDTVGRKQAVRADTLSVTADTLAKTADSLSVVSDTLAITADTLSVSADSLSFTADSLSASVDSLAAVPPPPDTTEVSFVEAYHHVKIYRQDIQALCDSLLFTSIDSIARMFKSPVIWYDLKNQVTADSMQFLLRDRELDRGLLFSNSFVISEEEPGKYYHQIKSPEMIGYFSGTKLSRFDALGGVNAVFFIAEDSIITTVNKKDTRIMSAYLKDGELQRILNLESVKSDAYPVFDMKPEEYTLRGYNWQPELRPADRFALTDRPVRKSMRKFMVPSPDFPEFPNSARFFEGYMEGVIKEIESRKPLVWLK